MPTGTSTSDATEEWEPISLSAPLFGHLLTGALKAPVMVLVLWGATFLPPVGERPLDDLIFTVIVALVVTETLSTFIDRAFVLHYRQDDPGTKLNHVLTVIASFIIGFVAGLILLGDGPAGFACSAAVGVVMFVEVLWMRPWKHAISRQEAAEKWAETKEMTQEVFKDDTREVMRRAGDNQRRRWRRRVDKQDE